MVKEKHRILSSRQIQEMNEKVKLDAVAQTMLLCAGFLMDDFEYDPDSILEFWDGVSRYASAVKDHLITLDQVAGIINDHTGLAIHFRR